MTGATRTSPAAAKHDTVSHLPPHNIEAEEALLGAMLTAAFAIEVADEIGITSTAFYRESHRLIFEAIKRCADNGPVDTLVVINELRARRELETVGGSIIVASLEERCPAVANTRAYASEVLGQSQRRALVETGHAIATLGYEGTDEPTQLQSQAAMLLAERVDTTSTGNEWVTVDELLPKLYEQLSEYADQGRPRGTSTGYPDLDKKIGGLHGGRVVVLGARPGMGKSALAMNIAENVAMNSGEHVAIISMEMSAEDVAARIWSSVTKTDGQRLTSTIPADDDWPHLLAGIERIQQQAPGRIHLTTPATLSPAALRARIRRLHRQLKKRSAKLGLVVVDYLQLMEGDRRRGDTRDTEVSAISRSIKQMALELDVPVLLLVQLNRQVEQRPDKRPVLADLRESGGIEQDADVVLLILRPEYYMRENTPPELLGKAEVIVAKQRRGTPGSVWLGFLGKYTKFVSITKGHDS